MNASLYKRVYQASNLLAAWERVEASDGCAGIDGVSLARFARNLEDELARLRRDLESETYTPLPLVRFSVEKGDGRLRLLNIPAVRDRVAQHAAIRVLAPVIEAEFEACSYAYRRGRSVQQALTRVEALREENFKWVVEADITEFFDSVDHQLLGQRLAGLVSDERLLRLTMGWVAARIYDGRRLSQMSRGLPQGAPISPILANLYLDHFDDRIEKEGRRLVRFADDFLILCKSKPKAEAALRLTRNIMSELRLTLRADRTRVTNFAEGFKFLGAVFTHSFLVRERREAGAKEGRVNIPPPLKVLRHMEDDPDFNPTLKEALVRALSSSGETTLPTGLAGLTIETQSSDSMRSDGSDVSGANGAAAGFPPPALLTLNTLYLHEHGATLRCENERLQVVKDGVELFDHPARKIDQILVFGNSQITSSAMKHCLKTRKPILILSSRGRFLGSVEAGGENMELQRLQFERLKDEAFTVEFARRVVEGKIENCRALLQRRHRSHASDEVLLRSVSRLSEAQSGLSRAATLDEVRGYEGAASAEYFKGLGRCFPESLPFTSRTRRPPRDPANSLLSLGYTLLLYNIYAIVRARGLSPYIGLLHALRRGHPALCSDLIEELRAPVVDSLATTLANKRVVRADDFSYEEADEGAEDEKDGGGGVEAHAGGRARGCFLNDRARKVFIEQFERRMNTLVRHPSAGLRTTWRGCIDLQVGHLVRVLKGDAPFYVPLQIR